MKKVSYGLDGGKKLACLCKKGDKMQAFQSNNGAKRIGSCWFYNPVTEEQGAFSRKAANSKLKTLI